MALSLCIDTSSKNCSVAIFENSKLISVKEKKFDKSSHSEKVNEFIHILLKEKKISFSDFDFFAISNGPGSFTGLRIGVATVKAFCFANKRPLVSVSSMKIMSEKVIRTNNDFDLYCAVVDARGNEVYYSQFDIKNNNIVPTCLISIDQIKLLVNKKQKYIFFGDAVDKIKIIASQKKIKFLKDIYPSASDMGAVAYQKFKNKNFEILENFEPNYLKAFIVNKK
tara:strand:- start:932 stop:1603 length:672 start_codon:yes stop_codon:yes gene_type:complete